MVIGKNISKLAPLLLTFFVMGYVDLVGIATNYVKEEFVLSDTAANLLTTMVFFWYLVLSVPTGILMSRFGRKKVTLLSLVITIIALVVPLVSYSFGSILLSFMLIGVANVFMQVSLNPLIGGIVSGKYLASTLTFGQFIKAIASFLGPMMAAYAALRFNSWVSMYMLLIVVAILTLIYLAATKIEDKPSSSISTFKGSFSLLGDRVVFLLFVAILVHAGFDVGLNVTAPKLMIQRFDMPLEEAGFATSLYFIFRTVGALIGAFIMSRVSIKRFFIVNILMLSTGVAGLLYSLDIDIIYCSIAILGLGNANIFSTIVSQSLLYRPDKSNEMSALMLMGAVGGAIFPPLMGIASDSINSQLGAVVVLLFCVAYLWLIVPIVKERKS